MGSFSNSFISPLIPPLFESTVTTDHRAETSSVPGLPKSEVFDIEKVEAVNGRHAGTQCRIGNPTVIGSWGFATVFLIMGIHKLVLPTAAANVMLPSAFWYAGLVQFLSGFLILFTGKTFAATVNISWGAYWLGNGMMMIPTVGNSMNNYASIEDRNSAMAIYGLVWAFVAFFMFVISLKIRGGNFFLSWGLFHIFTNLLFESAYYLTQHTSLMRLSGAFSLLAALGAYYGGVADIFAEQDIYLWVGKYANN
ncbi:GPR1/FUN34/yaaH family-domain-containing protein [Pilobolus umbonatus]|nr:GPR1/FUN34/yaaH family-domain-containing protein [Pilobolus umbonatus]